MADGRELTAASRYFSYHYCPDAGNLAVTPLPVYSVSESFLTIDEELNVLDPSPPPAEDRVRDFFNNRPSALPPKSSGR